MKGRCDKAGPYGCYVEVKSKVSYCLYMPYQAGRGKKPPG